MSTDLGCRSAVGAQTSNQGLVGLGTGAKPGTPSRNMKRPDGTSPQQPGSQWLGGPHAELIVLIFSRKSFVSPQADVQVFI